MTQHSPNTLKIHVISCGIQGELSAQCQTILAQAEIIFASRTLLAELAMRYNANAEHHTIAAKAKDNAAHVIALARQGKHVVILASGDALYHGFGATLYNNLNTIRAELSHDEEQLAALPELIFHPHITAFQELFHRLGLPWSEAKLFSVHSAQTGSHKNILPLRQFAESPLCVIYAGTRFTATDIAKALIEFLPESASRPAILAEQLGTATERILQASLEEIAREPNGQCSPTSILVLKPHASCHALPLPLGLAEEEYQRERNLITASDARAIIISRLRLPSQGLMWDIGAGSGSVGLEAAALRPELKVIAVERKIERTRMIDANAQSLGIANHVCVTGEAVPAMLKFSARQDRNWPDRNWQGRNRPDRTHPDGNRPDRIFIGGGGADLPAILDLCMECLSPNGLMLVSSVTMESFTALYQWRPESRRDVTTISIAREASIAGHYHHMRHQNSISLFTFSK